MQLDRLSPLHLAGYGATYSMCPAASAKIKKIKKVSQVSFFMFSGRVPASGVGLQVRHVHPGEETEAGGEVT